MRFMIGLIAFLVGLSLGGLLISLNKHQKTMQEFTLQASPSLSSVMNPPKFNP